MIKVANVSSKIVGRRLCSLSDLYERRAIAKSMRIIGDTLHKLISQYEVLQSGKRYLVPLFKTGQGKSSFIPTSVKLLNKHHWAC